MSATNVDADEVLYGTIAPDGRRFVFAKAEASGAGRLYLLEVASGKVRLLTPRAGKRIEPRWSLDGKRIAFWGEVVLPGHPEPVGGTWVVDAATGAEQLALAAGQFNFTPSPTWTRDGRLVVAEPQGEIGPDGDILPTFGLRIVDSRSGATSRLTEAGKVFESPAVSPDGQEVAYLGGGCAPGASALYLAPIANGKLGTPRCVDPIVAGSSLAWSADGRRVYVLASQHAGRPRNVLLIDVATGQQDSVSLPGLDPDIRAISVTNDDRLVIAARFARTQEHVAPARDSTPFVTGRGATFNVTVGIWELQLPHTESRSPQAAAADSVRVTANLVADTLRRPDERLLNLVERIAARTPELDAIWPGYWRANQPFALYASRGTPGTILVAREPFVAGFREVPIAHPVSWGLHAYWRAGPPIELSGLGLRVAMIDSLPPPADSLSLVGWRERTLSLLFLGDPADPFDGTGEHWEPPLFHQAPELPRRSTGVCPTGFPSSCAAFGRVERRALSAALAASPSQAVESARQYVAVSWLRRHTSIDPNWAFERADGTRAYIARRASAVVAGRDTTGLASEIAASFNQLPPTDAGAFDFSHRRETLTGEALIVLLERLRYDWKADVSRGDDLFDALRRAVQFDPTRALHVAKRAYDAYDLENALGETHRDTSRLAAETAKNNQVFYYTLLALAIARDSTPLVLTLPTGRDRQLDTARFRIRYSAGEGDSASTTSGAVMLPDAESVVVETNGLRLEVHHVPVLIDRAPAASATGIEISFFLPDSVAARIRNKRLGSANVPADGDEHVLAPGIDLLFAGGTTVGRTDMYWKRIAVTVAAPPSAPRR